MQMLIPVLLSLALVGCAGAPKKQLTVKLAPLEDGTCMASIDGEAVKSEQALERFTALHQDYSDAIIVGSGNIEYRCIGFIIFNLQKAGFRKVRFEAVAGS